MITPHPSAPDGAVTTVEFYSPTTFRGDTVAILCRNNAPLVAHAFAAIRRDMPVRILGRELGAGLTKIIKSWKLDATFAWEPKATNWFERESRRCRKASQRDALEDKLNCLRAVCRASMSEADAVGKIERLFVAAGVAGALTLSTGHKAKGQEWDHVFILDQNLIPSRWCEGADELTQERNLLYVMVTRARLTLTYIKSDRWEMR